MNQIIKLRSLVLAAILLLAAILISLNLTPKGSSPVSDVMPGVAIDTVRGGAQVNIPEPSQLGLPRAEQVMNQEDEFDALQQDLISRMKQQYRETITDIAIQASLKEFLVDLLKSYPARGRDLFVAVIQGAFPELAADIIHVVDTMVIYDEWLLDNHLRLSEMPPLEYSGTLWEKRRELFGNDAERIWSSEISAKEERRKALQKTVSMLDQAYDTTMDERIYILQSAFDEQYSETVENVVFDSRGVLSQVLFGFDSVQKELALMSNEERQQEIDSIRRSIGFAEEQIEHLSKLDQDREKRWQNGYAYMAARDELLAQQSGEDLEVALEALRVKFFAHEATTIAREEQDEFFRFTRQRIYGRN